MEKFYFQRIFSRSTLRSIRLSYKVYYTLQKRSQNIFKVSLASRWHTCASWFSSRLTYIIIAHSHSMHRKSSLSVKVIFHLKIQHLKYNTYVLRPRRIAARRHWSRCSSLLGTTKNATKSLSLGQCPPLTTQLRHSATHVTLLS